VNWWIIAAMLTFDIYVVCLVVLAFAIKTAPLVPSSQEL